MTHYAEVRFGLFTSSLALVHELDATYALPLRLTSLLSLVRSSSGSVSRLLKQSDSRKHPVSNEKDSEIQGLQPKSSKKRVLLQPCSFLICPDVFAPAALANLLFDPPEPQIIGKNTVLGDFPTFSRTCIFSLLTFSISYLLTSDCLPV